MRFVSSSYTRVSLQVKANFSSYFSGVIGLKCKRLGASGTLQACNRFRQVGTNPIRAIRKHLWTAQQIVEAFADRDATQYWIRDRDSKYSAELRLLIKSLGIKEILTAPKSPQNGKPALDYDDPTP
jgi:hypothetical protein